MFLVLLLLAAWPAAAVELSPRLERWKAEIEEKGGKAVAVARVEFSADGAEMRLAADAPLRAVMAEYLKQPDFAAQFRHMFAVMVHHRGITGEAFLVLLNGAREAEWRGAEDAVIGHELGHAWLKALGYPAPVFQPGPAACLGIHAGDIVQHVLIRRELDARGIEHVPFWLRTLDAAAREGASMKPPTEEDRCARVRQAAQLVDARLGLEGVEWPGRAAYAAGVKRVFPEVEGTARALEAYLRENDVGDKERHRAALEFVFARLRDLAAHRSRDYILENRRLTHPIGGMAEGCCVNLNVD